MDVRELMAKDPARDDMLVLVDGFDREIGSAAKWEVHRDGLLHRAFSVVLLREGRKGIELLLTKRSQDKYHSAGLWANTCCSHPRVGEDLFDAAYRRVHEELGVHAVDLREIGSFTYRTELDNGLWEYEYDHVLVGTMEGMLAPDLGEVSDVRWVNLETLAGELASDPQKFTAWTPGVLCAVLASISAAE